MLSKNGLCYFRCTKHGQWLPENRPPDDIKLGICLRKFVLHEALIRTNAHRGRVR